MECQSLFSEENKQQKTKTNKQKKKKKKKKKKKNNNNMNTISKCHMFKILSRMLSSKSVMVTKFSAY